MPDGADLPHFQLGDLLNRIVKLEAELAGTRSELAHEIERIDYVLGDTEGLDALRDDFLSIRHTPVYQEAFTIDAPLVTVCVATMDRADLLLARSLPSLLAQTHRNLQIVVVGDNCTDDTAARIAALGDSRIEFVNLPHRGPYPAPGRARWMVAGTNPANEALARARGHFITHLDDDDSFDPARIATLVAAAQQHRADLVWHPFWWQQPDGTWLPLGDGTFRHGQVGTSMVLYHGFFARLPCDVYAYRKNEPGDWNRFRRIKYLRPTLHYVPEPLTWYHQNRTSPPFIPRPGEEFLA